MWSSTPAKILITLREWMPPRKGGRSDKTRATYLPKNTNLYNIVSPMYGANAYPIAKITEVVTDLMHIGRNYESPKIVKFLTPNCWSGTIKSN